MNKKYDGRSRTKLYKSWENMKRRCNYPDKLHAKYYKEIHICKEWESFDNFRDWALHNGYIEGLTLERLDITKGYCPKNCTWIPKEKQNINRRNKSHLVICGIDKSFTEWAKEYGINETTIRMRIKYGWSGKDLLKPTKKYGLYNSYKKGDDCY